MLKCLIIMCVLGWIGALCSDLTADETWMQLYMKATTTRDIQSAKTLSKLENKLLSLGPKSSFSVKGYVCVFLPKNCTVLR